jgi:hypothetical protein
VAEIEVAPAPARDVDQDAEELVGELNALGHAASTKLDESAHAGIAIAIRVLAVTGAIGEIEEQIRRLLGLMRRRREERGASREVVAVYGPNGDVLLEVEI